MNYKLIALPIAIVALIIGIWFFYRDRGIQSDYQARVQSAISIQGSGDATGTGSTLFDLSDDDKRYLVVGTRLLRSEAFSETKSRPIDDDFSRQVIESADAHENSSRLQTPDGVPSAIDVASSAERFWSGKSLAQREEAAALISKHIDEIVERQRVATAQRSIMQFVEAKASLKVLHDNLLRAGGDPDLVPKVPEALIPPVEIDALTGKLVQWQQALDASLAKQESSDLRWQSERLALFSEHLKSLRNSPEYLASHGRHGSIGKVLSSISSKTWAKIGAGFDAARERQLAREYELLAEIPGYSSAELTSQSSRGPPADSIAAAIIRSTREFATDPVRSARSAAMINSLLKEIGIARQKLVAGLSRSDAHAIYRSVRVTDSVSSGSGSHHVDDRYFWEQNKQWSAVLQTPELQAKMLATGVDESAHRSPSHEQQWREMLVRGPPPQEFLVEATQRWQNWKNMPPDAVKECQRFWGETAESQFTQVNDMWAEYHNLQLKASLAVGNKGGESLSKMRQAVNEAALHCWSYLDEAESRGVSVDSKEKKCAHLLTYVLATQPPKDIPPEGPAAPVPPKVPPNSPLTPSGGLAKALVDFKEATSQIELALKEVPTAPRRFAIEKGRRTIKEEDLQGNELVLAKAEYDPEITRLPESQKDWIGRLDEEGMPYDFENEVRNVRQLRAVGGGMEMRTLASLTTQHLFQTLSRNRPSTKRRTCQSVSPVGTCSRKKRSDLGGNLGQHNISTCRRNNLLEQQRWTVMM